MTLLLALVAAASVVARPGAPGTPTPPIAGTSTPGDSLDREAARRAAEQRAAERDERERAELSQFRTAPAERDATLPVETPCYPIHRVIVTGADASPLRWVRSYAQRYVGQCVGTAGLDAILRAFEGVFLGSGLATTRAGLPAQDLASGTLRLVVVPGRVAGFSGEHAVRAWRHAFPRSTGDVLTLRALEQGLDQMRRVPGREVAIELRPGPQPGDSLVDVAVRDPWPLSAALSVNNYAGETLGHWQGAAQVSTVDLLGLSEVATLSLNSRLKSPSLPADSRSTGLSLAVPFGWWAFGGSALRSRYGQRVVGEVATFDTSGKLAALSGWGERVIRRDRVSRTALRATLQRRWGRSAIDGIEIGLQHQDLTDIALALSHRQQLRRGQIDIELGRRQGVPWLGAQPEPATRPRVLPTARYKLTTLDLGASADLGGTIGYHAALHAQLSRRPLYGSDEIAVGGPFTVRGYPGQRALIGRSGWFLRQELNAQVGRGLTSYLLADTGRVRGARGRPLSVGAGAHAHALGTDLDTWVALPLTARTRLGARSALLGLTAGWSL